MLIVFYIIFSACLGSVCNMLIYRLNNNVSLFKPGKSICPLCKHELSVKDLIPVISYLLLKGSCRYCKKQIPLRYLLVELLFIGCGLTAYFLNLSLAVLFLYFSLVGAFFSDVEKQEIPYFFPIVAASAVFLTVDWHNLGSFIPLVFVAVFSLLVYLAGKYIYRRPIFGGADILIFIIFALYFTLLKFFLMFYASFLLGAIFAFIMIGLKKLSKKDFIPFAPFIILSFFITEFFGDYLLDIYFKIYLQ